jgi:hypothetical protein
MTVVKVLKYDVRTGKQEIVEEDITLPSTLPMPEGINLEEIKKLMTYAKKMDWI